MGKGSVSLTSLTEPLREPVADVLVVGHVTKDLIRIPGRAEAEQPGGSAFYVAAALSRLGLDVEVLTRVAPADDPDLLQPLRALGVRVRNLPTPSTTVFENAYRDPSLRRRDQRVLGLAAPFSPADLEGRAARAIHLGPLTQGELGPGVIAAARLRTQRLALDGQGLLRRLVAVGDGGAGWRVEPARWSDEDRALAMLDVLKVDDAEAEALVGVRAPEGAAARLADLGVKEVLITFADRGSLLHVDGEGQRIPAAAPRAVVDATGCGDTYAAGYLGRRLAGHAPLAAARFAAVIAAAKLEARGPFLGDATELEARLASWRP